VTSRLGLGELVFRDYEAFREAHFELWRRLTRSEVRPLREADVICAVDLRRAVEGYVNGRRNLLLSNFFSLFHGVLNEAALTIVDYGGTSASLRAYNDPTSGSAYLIFGTGATPPAFNDYKLVSRDTTLEGSTLTPSAYISADMGRIRFGRGAAGTVYEEALYQTAIDTGGNGRGVIWARAVFSGGVPAGKTILHDVVLKAPFVQNLTYVFLGVLTEANRAETVDINGAAYTVRSAGDVQAAAASRLFVGEGTAGLDHTVKTPTNPVELESSVVLTWSYGSYYRMAITGAKKLDTAKTISEVCLVQNLYDTAGNVRPTMIARWPVSPAASKAAGDVVCAYAIIYASA
jgi:hypothetical protein